MSGLQSRAVGGRQPDTSVRKRKTARGPLVATLSTSFMPLYDPTIYPLHITEGPAWSLGFGVGYTSQVPSEVLVSAHFNNTEYDGKVLGFIAECKDLYGKIHSFCFMPFGPAAVDDALGNSVEYQYSSLIFETVMFIIWYKRTIQTIGQTTFVWDSIKLQWPYTTQVLLPLKIDIYLAGIF